MRSKVNAGTHYVINKISSICYVNCIRIVVFVFIKRICYNGEIKFLSELVSVIIGGNRQFNIISNFFGNEFSVFQFYNSVLVTRKLIIKGHSVRDSSGNKFVFFSQNQHSVRIDIRIYCKIGNGKRKRFYV